MTNCAGLDPTARCCDGRRRRAPSRASHSGWGLETRSQDLPNYEMPDFDGIGANEFIVDVTHGSWRFPYSAFNATIASTRVARRAGM
jgi:hypothetical protein